MDFLPRPEVSKTNLPKSKGSDGKEKYEIPLKIRWDVVRRRSIDNGDVLFSGFCLLWFYGLYKVCTLNPAPTALEKWFTDNYDLIGIAQYWQDHPEIPMVTGLLYILLLTAGPKIMENFERPKILKPMIIVWNFILVVFSTFGAYRVIQGVYFVFSSENSFPSATWRGENPMDIPSAHHFVCKNADGRCKSDTFQNECGWLMLFCASKIPEMLDTVFIIAAKKKPIFLHWFHHLTVMLFCWVSWAYLTPVGILYSAMNYTVHSLMYAWYGLAAVGRKPTRLLSQAVTVLQIIQMIFGSTLALYVGFAPDCDNHWKATTTGLLIYGTYLGLFVKFFFDAYYKPRSKRKKGEKKTKKA